MPAWTTSSMTRFCSRPICNDIALLSQLGSLKTIGLWSRCLYALFIRREGAKVEAVRASTTPSVISSIAEKP